MKITAVETVPVHRYLFVRVHTDEGISGLGEAGNWGYLEAAEKAIEKFGRYLVGQDPLRIEHHWQYMYRSSHWRGAAVMAAISAIDIALWDIAGKHHGVSVYQLLGGRCRDKARVYYHVLGRTMDELVEGCVEAKRLGFNAVGHLMPFPEDLAVASHSGAPKSKSHDAVEDVRQFARVPYFKTHSSKIRDAIDAVRQFREAVGNDVDLCIEIHRRLTPAEAIVLGKGVEDLHPMFLEDPITPDNFDEMALVARSINVPIATGERLHTIWEFDMLLSRNAAQFIRPDVCHCGGITHAKKIAALAEAKHVGVVPHNPLSPVSTAACLQLAACIPNFAIQEYPIGEDQPPKSEIVKGAPKAEKGFLMIPEAPGIGVEFVEGSQEKYPYRPREVVTRLHLDGSVVDQ